MFDFLKTLFNPAPPSSTTAKERLRLVLLSDHLSLSPETVQALKADLLAVISKYVEIDPRHADVTFEHRENEVAMLANIPITGVRERKRAIDENVAPPVAPQPATASAALAVAPTAAPASPAAAVPPPLDLAARGDAPHLTSATDDVEDEIARNSAAVLSMGVDARPTLDLRAEAIDVEPPTPGVPLDPPDDLPDRTAAATRAVVATPTEAAPSDASAPPARANHATRRRRRKKNQNAAQRPPAPQSFGKPAQA